MPRTSQQVEKELEELEDKLFECEIGYEVYYLMRQELLKEQAQIEKIEQDMEG